MNDYDFLKYSTTGIAAPDMSAYDKMRALAMGGAKYPVATITGVPPLSFKADGTPLISWSMIGNGVQSGTPTPDAPIMPEFLGVRTENLFDKTATNTNNGYISDGYLKSDGSKNANVDYRASEYIAISPNQSYVLRYGSNLNQPSVCFYDSSKNFISGIAYSGQWTVTFTTPQNAAFLRLSFRTIDFDKVILNLGSTALPYEPYGYKIPITCAGQTVPVYLGQVSTVRRVKKLVLDGTETGIFTDRGLGYIRIVGGLSEQIAPYSDKLIGTTDGSAGRPVFSIRQSPLDSTSPVLSIKADADFPNAAAFKSWLAENHITVWYILTEPETAIVNEPLCKIGTYADELHSEDAGVTIQTVKGNNTLTVDTDLQPSSVSITGHIKPST